MDRRRWILKSILLYLTFIVVLVKATHKNKVISKYILTSTKENKINFKVLKIQRR